MSPSKALSAGLVAAACGLTACALLDGLGSYGECTSDCDASARPHDGALPDASPSIDAAADGASAGDAGDGGAAADDGEAEAEDSGDASATGDGASDAGGDGSSPFDAGPTCQAPTDIDGGLLVYYPLEGNTDDHSGNGNNGSATAGTDAGGDIMYGPGKLGQGVTILSTGRGIAVSGAGTLGAARTLCAWVNAVTGTTGGGLPLFVAGTTGSGDLYDVSTANPNDTCATQVRNTLFIDHWGTGCFSSSLAPSPGAWSFVCIAQTASSTAFFMNGATATLSTDTFSAALDTLTIGSDRIGGSTTQVLFKGQLDEISIWSAPLSSGDMNALYNGGNGCVVR